MHTILANLTVFYKLAPHLEPDPVTVNVSKFSLVLQIKVSVPFQNYIVIQLTTLCVDAKGVCLSTSGIQSDSV